MGTEPFSRRAFLSAAGLTGLSVPLLSACGGGASSDPNAKVTLEWWNITTTDPAKSLWASIAKAYQTAHPNVTIKITTLENEAYKAKMTAQTASGKLPDIFHTWGGGVLKQQVDAGLVKDLTQDIAPWSGTLSKTALAAYQLDGKTYGVPFDIGMVGFWYNKALFDEAGIAEPPATWAEFLEDVRKLKAAGITPLALAGKEKWPGHYYWAYLAMRVGGASVFQQATSSNDFSGPAFVEAGRQLKALVDLAPFQTGFLGAAYDGPGGEAATVGNGKAAMELMGQWAPQVHASAGEGLGKDTGFFPFPTVDGGQGAVTDIFGGGGGHALRTDAPPAAVDFLKFFASVDNDRKLVSTTGLLPVTKGAEDALKDPNLQVISQSLDKATGFQLFLDQAFPPAVGQQVNDSTATLIAGKASPEQVTQQITQTAKDQ